MHAPKSLGIILGLLGFAFAGCPGDSNFYFSGTIETMPDEAKAILNLEHLTLDGEQWCSFPQTVFLVDLQNIAYKPFTDNKWQSGHFNCHYPFKRVGANIKNENGVWKYFLDMLCDENNEENVRCPI